MLESMTYLKVEFKVTMRMFTAEKKKCCLRVNLNCFIFYLLQQN